MKFSWLQKVLLLFLSLSNSSFCAHNESPFNPDRLIDVQNAITFETSQIIHRSLEETFPLENGMIPPEGKLGYFPLVITNNTGLPAQNLFVLAKGQKVDNLNAFFVKPNLPSPICELVMGNTANSADSSISTRLSELPSAGPNSYYLYIPQMISGRLYLSVNTPLYLETTTNGGLVAINDPSHTTTQDPNYYTLYQSIEFTLDANYELYTNVTNVDYVCLPYTFGSYTYPTGEPFTTLDGLTQVGFPSTLPRSSILSALRTGLTNGDASLTPQWSALTIPFYSDPYTVSAPLTDMRVIAAKLSIALGNSYQFKAEANPQTFFNSLYLEDTTSGPAVGKSYYDQLHAYYLSNQLDLTVFPAGQPITSYALTSDPTPLMLNFTRTAGTGPNLITLQLNDLTTEELLGGDVGSWVSAFSPSAADPWQTEIAKIISTLFTAGFLPPPVGLSSITANEEFLVNYRSQYFSNPPGFSLYGPWYNLYDKLVHPLLLHTNGFGLGYAYDFDDLLGLAGLLHLVIQKNGELNPNQPYVVLSAGPIDTPIPNPLSDYGPYTLNIGSLGLLSNPIDVIYSTSSSQSPNITYSVTSTPSGAITNVYNYFLVRYYTDSSKTTSFTYKVYPKYQLVLPTTTRFNHQDVTLMNGIVFNPSTTSGNFYVDLPNTNPFPPAN